MVTVLRVVSFVLVTVAVVPGVEAADWKRLGETERMEVFAMTDQSGWCREVPTVEFRFSRDVVVYGGFAAKEAAEVAKWARKNCDAVEWLRVRAQELRGDESLYLGKLRKQGDWDLTLRPTWNAGTENEYRRVVKLDRYGVAALYGLDGEWCGKTPTVRVVPYEREGRDEEMLLKADARIGKALAEVCGDAEAFEVSVRKSIEGAEIEHGRLAQRDGVWKLAFASGAPTNPRADDVSDISLRDFREPTYHALLKSYLADNPDVRSKQATLRVFGRYTECPEFKKNTQVALGKEDYLEGLSRRLRDFASDPYRQFYSEVPAEIGEYDKQRQAFPLRVDHNLTSPLLYISDREGIQPCEEELKAELGPEVPHAVEVDLDWVDQVDWVEVPRERAEQILQDRFVSGRVEREVQLIVKYRITEVSRPQVMDADGLEQKAIAKAEPVLIAVANTSGYIDYDDRVDEPTPVLKTVTAEELES